MPYEPAGVCYSCSISCHGEHTLVELFSKRNFVCDCGTTRFPETSPCSLRLDETTGAKGGIHSELPAIENRYNHNFRNSFCGCGEEYDPQKEKGTMFQCLGLGTVVDGGCGEDWWHPECILGMSRDAYKKSMENATKKEKKPEQTTSAKSQDGLAPVQEESNTSTSLDVVPTEQSHTDQDEEDLPLPPGFPEEDAFEYFLCYKCVDSFSWIKQYGRCVDGFLAPVFYKPDTNDTEPQATLEPQGNLSSTSEGVTPTDPSKKRKAEVDTAGQGIAELVKRQRSGVPLEAQPPTDVDTQTHTTSCKLNTLPPAPAGKFSLFLKEDFRKHICRCASCFPHLKPHPQLLEEEEAYEPPISEGGDDHGGQSIGTGSLLDRGEAAFSNMDRVRAIEGAMVYAHLKDKVKSFLQPFAESGRAVGAEDIKAYFETLRGDSAAISAARGDAAVARHLHKKEDDDDDPDGPDNRREQSGKLIPKFNIEFKSDLFLRILRVVKRFNKQRSISPYIYSSPG